VGVAVAVAVAMAMAVAAAVAMMATAAVRNECSVCGYIGPTAVRNICSS
jgi:hypothetical protein